MISRTYFYTSQAQIDHHSYKSLSGVVTVKSWMPQPVTAFRKALDAVKEVTNIEQEKTTITRFERVK